MPNPLFNTLGGGNNPMTGMLSEFYKFKANLQGDAKQQVQELLNSGRMTQQQYNQLQQPALMLYNLIKR